jgi:hypothetical protein
MRNLAQYPITREEIVELLTRLRIREEQEIAERGTIGAVSPTVLNEAIRIIIESK